ncbi:MAG: type II toxin-antitoxin system HicB family antitoxin [Cyclobacteriaceae bacterium]|nr:type II toxin-antitoxin system HicB family antitoxin [Cyclobacteriaceae bacterium]
MNRVFQFTAVIEQERDGHVSLCPELDIASQGQTIEETKDNLKEAVGLFFEHASKDEIGSRYRNEIFVTRLEVSVLNSRYFEVPGFVKS